MSEEKVYEIGILKSQKKYFKNSEGEVIPYNEYSVVLNGQKFLLKPYDKDKSFFNYMVSSLLTLID